VYNFNKKYLVLYDQLETEDKASISIINYINTLLPRTQIYIKIALEEYDLLEDAEQKNMKIYYRNLTREMKEVQIIITIIHLLRY